MIDALSIATEAAVGIVATVLDANGFESADFDDETLELFGEVAIRALLLAAEVVNDHYVARVV